MSRPKILDLFCCEGGASMGYHRAGFDVYGVDLFKHVKTHPDGSPVLDKRGKPVKVGFSQKRYPFPSHQGDALLTMERLLDGRPVFFRVRDGAWVGLRLEDFDAISASPPCQKYSITNAARRAYYPDLVGPIRGLLQQTGLPYVIENVEGSPLDDPLLLCGTMFGLGAIDDDGTPLEMWRHRLFESNVPLSSSTWWNLGAGCKHGWYSQQVAGSYGGARRDKHEARNVRHGGYVPSKKVQQELLGIDWMTEGGMHQSIPPVYTQHIGKQILEHLARSKEAA